MKTSLLAAIALVLTACSGPAFSLASPAIVAPDGDTLAEVQAQGLLPDSGQALLTATDAPLEAVAPAEPDAEPQSLPDVVPVPVTPDVDPVVVNAGTPTVEAAVPVPDAPPSTPVVLCDSVAQAKLFVASTSEVDFVEGVGTVTMKRITLTDESSCSANVAINPMGAQGQFEVVSNCSALNPGDSCTITVTFLPSNVGRSVASWVVVILGQEYTMTAVGTGE